MPLDGDRAPVRRPSDHPARDLWPRNRLRSRARYPRAIRVLATQAYFGKRKEKFHGEFLLALKMLEDGYVKPAEMKSSWAGAMGLTQFLPSDFYKYAVDFDGDGRRDIWNSVPDALASAAKQLVDKGWQRGVRWSYEVHAPAASTAPSVFPKIPAADRRMDRGRVCAGLWAHRFCGGTRGDRIAAAAGRHFMVRRFSPRKIILPSRNIISPTLCPFRRPFKRSHH